MASTSLMCCFVLPCLIYCCILLFRLCLHVLVDDVIVGPLILIPGLEQLVAQSQQLPLHTLILLCLSDLLLLLVVIQDAFTRELSACSPWALLPYPGSFLQKVIHRLVYWGW